MSLNLKWLALAPLSWLVGGTMFAASFERVERVPVLVNPYNNQTAEMSFGVPTNAKMILLVGGGAIAIGGTAAAAFFGVGSSLISKRDANEETLREPLTTRIPVTGNQPARTTPTATTRAAQVQPKTTNHNHESLNEQEADSFVGGDLWQPHETEPIADSVRAPTPEPIVLLGYGNKTQTQPEQPELNLVRQAAVFGCGQNSDNIKVHLLIPAITQSGKTSTLCGMIREVVQICPDVIWHGVDPKGSVFLGLERLCHADGFPVIVSIDLDKPSVGVSMAVELLRRAIGEQTQRKKQRQKAMQSGQVYDPSPYVLILDEWPALLKAAKDCDLTSGTKHRQTIIQLAETLAFVGLEDKIFLWIVSQSPYVSQLGFDGSVSAQFCTFAIGRGFNMKSIEVCKKAIERSTSDDAQKVQLFAKLKKLSEARPYHPVCFSSAGGQIGYAPDLTDIQRQQLFRAESTDDEDIAHLRSLSPQAIALEFNQFLEQNRPDEAGDDKL
ncbi:type IV secretory system conjugative DNA transfer family protein [Laspinema olomoucense]|uniref:Type IV secretory system conjugative DNA transfer family protein n=1 Tax=Laspinema olomoucense D3b TaxID=2953688 RepID=A0ABT2NFI9_9CYAN|nr:type IV secretory system conjugative DNA transfer family protein [Laspinema sp. D3b]MCT7981453.1 type IV secretory system conjugative DNA transfer family protein [Laspinema sp. D3b]